MSQIITYKKISTDLYEKIQKITVSSNLAISELDKQIEDIQKGIDDQKKFKKDLVDLKIYLLSL